MLYISVSCAHVLMLGGWVGLDALFNKFVGTNKAQRCGGNKPMKGALWRVGGSVSLADPPPFAEGGGSIHPGPVARSFHVTL